MKAMMHMGIQTRENDGRRGSDFESQATHVTPERIGKHAALLATGIGQSGVRPLLKGTNSQ
jgi:hypothetical protein